MTKLPYPSILLLAGLFLLAGCQRQNLKPNLQTADMAREKAARRHEVLGDRYHEQQRDAEAKQEWTLALQLQPSNEALKQKMAMITTGGKRPYRIKAGAVKATGSAPLDKLLLQAEQFYEQSRLKEAEISWQRALSLAPQNADATAGLNRLREETYQADEERPFDKMAQALYEEGMSAYRQQDWERAQLKLKEAEKLIISQSQVSHYLNLVNEALARKAFKQEMLVLRQKAEALEAEEQWQDAWRVWQQRRQKMPDDPAGIQGLARCKQALQPWVDKELALGRKALETYNAASARRCFNNILSLFPDQSEARQGLNQAEALPQGGQQKPSGRQQAQAKFNEGVTLFRQGRYADAVGLWENAVRLDPEEGRYRTWLKKAKARATAQETQNMRQAEVRYADGLAAYQRGELEEALKDWKEVLSLNPGHEKAKINIERVEKELE